MDTLLDAVALRLKADELEKSSMMMRRKNFDDDCQDISTFVVDRNDIIASHTLTCIDGMNRHRLNKMSIEDDTASVVKRTKRISHPTYKAANSVVAAVSSTPPTMRNPNHRPRRGRKGKSIYRGVSHTREGKYRAVLYVERKQIYLGVFNDEVSAARAHDKGVIAHGLGTAYLNFKESTDDCPETLSSTDRTGSPHIASHVAGRRILRKRNENYWSIDFCDKRDTKTYVYEANESCEHPCSDATEIDSVLNSYENHKCSTK